MVVETNWNANRIPQAGLPPPPLPPPPLVVPAPFSILQTLKHSTTVAGTPKDPVGKDKVVGPVYKISCEDCKATHVGETERSLKARFGEHRRPSSTTLEVSRHIHSDNPNHNIKLENTEILSVEHKWFEWRKLFTSKHWILHWTKTVDVTIRPRSGITSSRRDWRRMELKPPMEGGGGGGPAWGILLPFQLVSSTIWRLRHTNEGCSDSRKLCKCCQIFILSNTVSTCIECYITRIDEST